jgi:AcrR family transcriptional regulator
MDKRTPGSQESPWMPFETRRRARDEKREAVLRMAMHLFFKQGYHRTTLDEVAERLNITKPALYNYFRSKDAILFEGWSQGRELIDECVVEIEAGGGSGLLRLRRLVHAYAKITTSPYGATLAWFQPHDLPDKNRKIVRDAKKRIDLVFRRFIIEGMADGSIGPCDPKLTVFVIAGSLNWIAQWYKPEGAFSPEEIADEFTARLTDGLARKELRKPKRRSAKR